MKFFRKTFAFLISAMIMASLVGCGASNEADEEEAAKIEEPKQQEVAQESKEENDITESTSESEETTDDSKILVLYFSRTGEQYTVGVIDKGTLIEKFNATKSL